MDDRSRTAAVYAGPQAWIAGCICLRLVSVAVHDLQQPFNSNYFLLKKCKCPTVFFVFLLGSSGGKMAVERCVTAVRAVRCHLLNPEVYRTWCVGLKVRFGAWGGLMLLCALEFCV